MQEITFDNLCTGLNIAKGTDGNTPLTEEVTADWSYNSFSGGEKKKPTKSSKGKVRKAPKNSSTDKPEGNQNVEVKTGDSINGEHTKNIEHKITGGTENQSILQCAVNNKGKYFAEKNREISMAEKHPYVLRDNIMTDAEITLLNFMDKVLNKYLRNIQARVMIFPKVRLADLIDVQKALVFNKKYFYAIAQKHVDFLIYDAGTMSLICAVELDDFYHSRRDRIARDEFVDSTLRDCGVTIFRVKCPIKEVNEGHLTNLIDYVLDFYTPICKECGCTMELKRSKHSNNYGHRFYGCLNWRPNKSGCNYTIDID